MKAKEVGVVAQVLNPKAMSRALESRKSSSCAKVGGLSIV
jgi:hypothetical protein